MRQHQSKVNFAQWSYLSFLMRVSIWVADWAWLLKAYLVTDELGICVVEIHASSLDA